MAEHTNNISLEYEGSKSLLNDLFEPPTRCWAVFANGGFLTLRFDDDPNDLINGKGLMELGDKAIVCLSGLDHSEAIASWADPEKKYELIFVELPTNVLRKFAIANGYVGLLFSDDLAKPCMHWVGASDPSRWNSVWVERPPFDRNMNAFPVALPCFEDTGDIVSRARAQDGALECLTFAGWEELAGTLAHGKGRLSSENRPIRGFIHPFWAVVLEIAVHNSVSDYWTRVLSLRVESGGRTVALVNF